MQPLWKDAMHLAHARLEAAQAESTARRRALIEEATSLGAAPQLRIDAVKVLQQRWQAEAHAVPLERKHEQKLWEAFRQPIDDAFARKSSEREKAASALSAHDQRVLDASKALEAASASGDAQRIRAAMQELEMALAGQAEASSSRKPAPAASKQAPVVAEVADAAPAAEAANAAGEAAPTDADAQPAEPVAPSKPAAPAKKLVAVRGDDRPGMKKAEPAARDGRRGDRPDGRRDASGMGRGDARGRGPGASDWREEREPRGPRLGDAAFRAQRQAIESAQSSLRKLAEQAHGEVLTQLMSAWEQRDAQLMPTAQTLGARVSAANRTAWVSALSGSPRQANAETMLRLEMAAEVPTPAEHLSDRRTLQLQLLTRKHAAAPTETWAEDVAAVLASSHEAAMARRLQNVLKVLLKR
jgi:ATP-dependent RNA helicase SUPV3L1/SUV3